jgi:NAD(P)-dependent dehydrogenase (short-subunit alcohol dehydrogenase family)
MTSRLTGKVAVITGAASGIGLATLELFVAEGAKVLAADLNVAVGQALERRFPGQVRLARCDVTKPADIKNAIELAVSDFGGLDILFNNAGSVGSNVSVENFDADGWDLTHHILLRSVAAGTAYALPHMKQRGGGSIICTSSISALQAGYAPIAYSVAKAGVLHYTRVAAAELSAHRIRINAVVPGFIATNIFGAAIGLNAEDSHKLAADIEGKSGHTNPVGRAGVSRDIAEAVLYLASEASGFVTGTHLTVDGGITLGPRHAWDPTSPSPMRATLQSSLADIAAAKGSAST